jgi:phosphotransferase system enzyme I (PtsI)
MADSVSGAASGTVAGAASGTAFGTASGTAFGTASGTGSGTGSGTALASVSLPGIGVSPGTAGGPVYRKGDPPVLPAPAPLRGEWTTSIEAGERSIHPTGAAEGERAREALRAVAADLTARAAASPAGPQRDIVDALALIAADPLLVDGVDEAMAAGHSAPHAVHAAFGKQRELLESLGGMMAERAADLVDLRDRAVAWLLGQPMPGLPQPGEPYVLVARDLAPVDTAVLDPAQVLALVTEEGGPTSHTAILAKTLGIPAVVACRGILDVPDGTLAVVDGTSGSVSVGVAAAEVDSARQAERRRAARLASSRGPGRTADGHPVALLLNIGSVADASAVQRVDAEGIGLFRTEFLFLDRTRPPTLDEQTRVYADVFAACGARPVVVRTLDAGADKPLAFLAGADTGPNPALGVRGLRIDRLHPEILDTQLAAVAAAASAIDAQVKVMAPMVATAAETEAFVARAHSHGLPVAGVMVEIPAAALHAPRLFEAGAAFLSIGTNDLAQYTLAADRQSAALADLLDPWQPALLRLIALCGDAGAAAGRPVSICGESASDPRLAPVLVGLGATSLSMSAASVAAVREALASVTLAECRALADAAVRADTPAAARAAQN